MDDGSWFRASGPAYENDRSPNFVLSILIVYMG